MPKASLEVRREKQRLYMIKYRARTYGPWRDLLHARLGGVCAKCGRVDNLEIDHIDPATKEMDPLAWPPKSKVRVDAEMLKCQLLCEPCHIAKTLVDKGQVPARGTHGTLSSYRYCRCDICRTFKSAYTKAHKKPKKQAVDSRVAESRIRNAEYAGSTPADSSI